MTHRNPFSLPGFLLGAVVAIVALAALSEFLPRPARAAGPQRAASADVEFFNPGTMHAPRGYTHVADVRSGRLVFIAGQVALDREGNLVGEGDIKAQAEQVFKNLQAAVTAVGGSFHDVVKLNFYITSDAGIPAVREVRDRYVNTQAPPASTAVVVSRLFRPEFLIEVEAVAALPQKARMLPAHR